MIDRHDDKLVNRKEELANEIVQSKSLYIENQTLKQTNKHLLEQDKTEKNQLSEVKAKEAALRQVTANIEAYVAEVDVLIASSDQENQLLQAQLEEDIGKQQDLEIEQLQAEIAQI